MTVRIGTSGWQYDSWRGPYYRGTPQRGWYEHVLADFATVELNVTFYRLPRASTFTGWRERAPADARIAVKASRFLTHVRRLRDTEPVRRLMERAGELGDRLGPVLVQLPPDLPADVDALAAVLAAFPDGVRVAVETRHPSWASEGVRALLTGRGAAWVWADRAEAALGPLWRTADWGYLRLHEGADPERGRPHYTPGRLAWWAERIASTYGEGDDVFAYFNNDPDCAAIDDAITFAAALDRLGVAATRVPAVRPGTGVMG